MRRFDKKKNMQKANQLAEQRHVESNSLIRESFHDVDGTPIGVDNMHRPITKEDSYVDADGQLHLDDTDPNKPKIRKDLVGHNDKFGKNVVFALEFPASGTFKAIGLAESYLKDLGYELGSMERDMPIGFTQNGGTEYYGGHMIGKWTRMTDEEQNLLDGVIIPNPEFREGGVLIMFFNAPNF
jgi:hypothetical protein